MNTSLKTWQCLYSPYSRNFSSKSFTVVGVLLLKHREGYQTLRHDKDEVCGSGRRIVCCLALWCWSLYWLLRFKILLRSSCCFLSMACTSVKSDCKIWRYGRKGSESKFGQRVRCMFKCTIQRLKGICVRTITCAAVILHACDLVVNQMDYVGVVIGLVHVGSRYGWLPKGYFAWLRRDHIVAMSFAIQLFSCE